jgi:hypothetical protein
MRLLPVLVVLLLAGAAPAQELTVAEVVAAHRAGAPEEGILRLIHEAPAVAPLGPADLARLRAAGVPERVIEAMVARTTPIPTATPARPDDQHLVEVVRMVNSGLSAELVAEQVRRSGQRYALTVNDLIYLKENEVADLVIVALVASGAPHTPVPASPAPTPMPALAAQPPPPTPMERMTFGPLRRMTGVFRRESTGIVVLAADRLEWQDARGTEQSALLPMASVRGAWLATVVRGASGSVFELRLRTVAGEDLTFRDADWASGGSAQVAKLYLVLEERFPQLILRERAAR